MFDILLEKSIRISVSILQQPGFMTWPSEE
jgi:hypothetical protein